MERAAQILQLVLYLKIIQLLTCVFRLGLGIDSRWCHWEFFRGTPDRTMCPEVDSASESEYQGFLLG